MTIEMLDMGLREKLEGLESLKGKSTLVSLRPMIAPSK